MSVAVPPSTNYSAHRVGRAAAASCRSGLDRGVAPRLLESSRSCACGYVSAYRPPVGDSTVMVWWSCRRRSFVRDVWHRSVLALSPTYKSFHPEWEWYTVDNTHTCSR
eukprot:TRINITY_DN48395_c0_g1_i1.p2 TRINITY_DN48395_c0_g1~~TRINITY_DN48395_c0_g1_i1.p2  ORF type:complete len:108 (+),score=4.01 TRINITY_DN48395_c0_g1_i1:303-626(+)